MSNNAVRSHYDQLQVNYLECWSSLAKQNISRFELNLISNAVKQISPKKKIKVLEVGIGPGRIAQIILKYPVEYYALDISSKMVEVSKSKFRGNIKIKKIIEADISQENPFPKEKFDLIVAIRVLYYNKNWTEIISKLSNKLNAGGLLVFCILNRYSSAVLGKFINQDQLRGHYTNLGELKSILRTNHLKTITLEGYARLPDVIYDKCNSNLSAATVRIVEKISSIFLGKTLFMRMFYVIAQKSKNKT